METETKPKEEKTEDNTAKIAEENAILEKNIALKKELKAIEDLGGRSTAGEQAPKPVQKSYKEECFDAIKKMEAGWNPLK